MKIFLTENQIANLQVILLSNLMDNKRKLNQEEQKEKIIKLCEYIKKASEILTVIETCKNMQ